MPTPRQKVSHNHIFVRTVPALAHALITHPYIFVMLKNVALFVMNVLFGKENSTNHLEFQMPTWKCVMVLKETKCRDGVVNDFLSWCRDLLHSCPDIPFIS